MAVLIITNLFVFYCLIISSSPTLSALSLPPDGGDEGEATAAELRLVYNTGSKSGFALNTDLMVLKAEIDGTQIFIISTRLQLSIN